VLVKVGALAEWQTFTTLDIPIETSLTVTAGSAHLRTDTLGFSAVRSAWLAFIPLLVNGTRLGWTVVLSHTLLGVPVAYETLVAVTAGKYYGIVLALMPIDVRVLTGGCTRVSVIAVVFIFRTYLRAIGGFDAKTGSDVFDITGVAEAAADTHVLIPRAYR